MKRGPCLDSSLEREPNMLTITDKAAEKIRTHLVAEGKDLGRFGLRITVEGGGCSGYQYRMDLAEAAPEDNVYLHADARVFVDPRSLLFIGDSVVDFQEGLTGAGFSVRNPNVTGTCGCGTSFSV